jgi:hypothetical protein
VPVVIALGWCALNRMSEGAGGAISFGWLHDARHAPVQTFVLSFGGVLVPTALGLWPWRGQTWRPALPAVAGLVLGVALMYFVSLTDRAWVGFRAGNFLFVIMPMLAARAVAGFTACRVRWAGVVLLTGVFLAAAPTTIIDAFNAQDTSNRHEGPGFLWTLPITATQQRGFDWIRRYAPVRAIVQDDPVVRGRQNWSVIPSFAGRRMAAGEPISLLPDAEYERRSQQVHHALTAAPAVEIHSLARTLGIEFFWLDHDDHATAAATMRRFADRPDLFTPVFAAGDVHIYRVN